MVWCFIDLELRPAWSLNCAVPPSGPNRARRKLRGAFLGAATRNGARDLAIGGGRPEGVDPTDTFAHDQKDQWPVCPREEPCFAGTRVQIGRPMTSLGKSRSITGMEYRSDDAEWQTADPAE
jgi:hypothetical protein